MVDQTPPQTPPKEKRPSFVLTGLKSASDGISARLATHREKVGGREFVRQMTYWLLLPTAFYTTWHGMNEIVSFNYPTAGLITVSITLLVAAMLFVLMNYTLSVFRSYDGLPARISSLAVYTLTAFLSVAFAFSFWWTVLSSRDRTADQTQLGAAAIVSIATKAQANLASLQGSLGDLATYSSQRAIEEETRGRTCGDSSPPGPGPRRDLRNNDASEFGSASAYMTTFVVGLTPQLATLETAARQVDTEEFRRANDTTRRQTISSINQAIGSVGAQLTRAKTDERFKSFEKQFNDRITLGRGFPAGGKILTCPDRNLESSLNAAIRSIHNVAAIQDFSGFRIQVFEGGEATMYAFQTFLNTFRSFIVGEPQDRVSTQTARQDVGERGDAKPDTDAAAIAAAGNVEPGVITGTQWFSFFLAVFIDVGIAFVGLGKMRDKNEILRSAVKEASDAKNDGLFDVLEAIKQPGSGLREQVGPYHVTVLGEDYLVTPNQPEKEPRISAFPIAAFSVGRLAALLSAARLAKEIAPNNLFLLELVRRVDRNLSAHGHQVDELFPDPKPRKDDELVLGGGMAPAMNASAPKWLSDATNSVLRFAGNVVVDPRAQMLRRRYRFFRASRGVFDNLSLQTVTRNMCQPPNI
ncbi:MAG: hypothetical protein Q8R02_13490 [Hyphomonadaceae bacterium]|nr:hypothetical protein [Hyphomonadaceae bacterium]